jgi:uncharacterized protein YjeT (DUF2065 family)
MIIFVKLFGIVIVVMGIIFLANPKTLKQYLLFWKNEKNLKKGGILSIAVGIIFLIAASDCRLAGLVTVLGIWSIIKGVLLLTFKQKKLLAYIDWWLEKSISKVRIMGIVALAIGALILYSA